MHKYVIPLGTGRTASDFLLDGRMKPIEFSAIHILQRHSRWGYASKCHKKSIKEWSALFQLERRMTFYYLKRLKDLGFLYQYPNRSKGDPQFIVFQESLSPEEMAVYINMFNENPKWRKIEKLDEKVEKPDLKSDNFKSQTIGFSEETDNDKETDIPFG